MERAKRTEPADCLCGVCLASCTAGSFTAFSHPRLSTFAAFGDAGRGGLHEQFPRLSSVYAPSVSCQRPPVCLLLLTWLPHDCIFARCFSATVFFDLFTYLFYMIISFLTKRVTVLQVNWAHTTNRVMWMGYRRGQVATLCGHVSNQRRRRR